MNLRVNYGCTEPVLFKAREDGHGVRGAGLLSVISGAPGSSTTVLGAAQPEDWPQKGFVSQGWKQSSPAT